MPQLNKINWGEIPFPPELQVQAWKDPDPININKLKELAIKMEAAKPFDFFLNQPVPQQVVIFDEFVEVPEPAPVPPPPIPISKLVAIDGEEIHVPMWANYITQDIDGYIQVWEEKPVQIGEYFSRVAGQHKEIMKPGYEIIIQPC